MNKISPLLRRCLFLPLLALMAAWDSTAQGFEPRIVFASNRDGDWDMYSMDVNGNNLVQLTDHPALMSIPLARRTDEGLRLPQSAALHLTCM